jgi:hypothetical protein
VAHLGDDVRIGGGVLHRGAVLAPVHGDVGGAGRGHHPVHLGVGEPAGDVVDELRTRLDRGCGGAGVHGVDADADAPGDELAHHGKDAGLLVLRRHTTGSGAGRLTADVDDVGSIRAERLGVGNRGTQVGPLPAIAERVRGDVEDSEDLWAGHP